MINLSRYAIVPDPLPEGVALTRFYLVRRGTRFDYAGPLDISSGSHWGYWVTVISRSHDISGGPNKMGKVVLRGVRVDSGAWICSAAILHNCHIGAGSIVAAGAVVRGQTVSPGVIVAGNPARVIARWSDDAGRWEYLSADECGFARELK